jgi:uncharacterized Zn-binding protein involved in type VI secretion
MAAVARKGDAVKTNHDCAAATTIATGSSDVLINGIGAATVGDKTASHAVSGRYCEVFHVYTLSSGSSSVFVNGKALLRVGDGGSEKVSAGSGTVSAG